MPEAVKKYKLFSAAGGIAEMQPCAFFATAKGCRSGDNCKFAHTKAHEKAGVHDAMVSSESSCDGEDESHVVEQQQDQQQQQSKIEAGGKSKQQQKVEVKAEESPFMTASEAKKAKKNKRGVDANPFANPQQSKKQKTENATAAPVPTASAATAAPIPTADAPKTTVTPKAKTKPPKHAPKSAPPKPAAAAASVTFDFRSLDLPIASFTIPGTESAAAKKDKKPVAEPAAAPVTEQVKTPLPTSTPSGRKWLDVVKKTREHSRYKNIYDLSKYMEQDKAAGYASNTWVKTQPFDATKAAHPQVIAIDCEMCETRDPVSGLKDPRALCRVSIIDVEKDEVLLDSLVKPMWPVTDYRTWVNGIAAENLENVQFTLRHAQAFMMALCTQETVILGHAVHNDLAAMRIEHPTVADSACLFAAADSETATVALRDLATHILQTTMPEKHDSVNDARISYQCLEVYRAAAASGSAVDLVPRTAKPSRPDFACQLFVHRIPKNACDETQLSQMFLAHTTIQPVEVEPIVYAGDSGTSGKTHVNFKSSRHGNLAFDSLDGKAVADASGRLQKKVFLKNGDYIRVRKMAFERKEGAGDKADFQRRLSS